MPAILAELDLAGALIGLGLILVVRPLIGLLALARCRLRARERVVVAAYGVRGVGSIYYLAYAGGHLELTNESQLWAIAGFTILISTVLHGFTAAFAVERATGEVQR
jgi:NhaP-type Na+/H+ or K+/H+ antiporter